MKTILTVLTCILIVGIAIIHTLFINPLKNQLSDCQFERNHLQAKINRLEALSEYELALNQVLTPKDWALLRTANAMIIREKQWEYEGREQSLLTEREKGG